jgi:hypothetical protein
MDTQQGVLFSVGVVELKRENNLNGPLPISVSGRNKPHKVSKLMKTVHYVAFFHYASSCIVTYLLWALLFSTQTYSQHNHISYLELKKPRKCCQGLSKLEENSMKHAECMSE